MYLKRIPREPVDTMENDPCNLVYRFFYMDVNLKCVTHGERQGNAVRTKNNQEKALITVDDVIATYYCKTW